MNIHHGCGIDGLFALEVGSVDLVLTDPPSGDTAAPFDVRPDLGAFWSATWHALKPTGIAVVMASSFRFAEAVVEASRKEFRYDLIWRKAQGTGFLNAKVRPLRNHEFVLVFWRKVGTFNPQFTEGDPINANRQKGKSHMRGRSTNYGVGGNAPSRVGETSRYPLSVLEFSAVRNASNPDRIHPQQKPDGLMAYLVRTYSNQGDLVADPFSGSGSTGRAALTESRRFVGWDTNEEFVKAATQQPVLFGAGQE